MAAPHFVENRGQVPNADVRFYAEGDPLSVGLTPWGAVFILEEDGARSTAFSMRFSGSQGAEPRGTGRLGRTESFYVGDDPSRWVQDAPAYEEVVLEGLYDGLDVRFYFRDGLLKYDLVLAPGVDPSVVLVVYEGVDDVSVDPATGELVISTHLGPLRDARPVAYQEGPDCRCEVTVAFEKVGPTSTVFKVMGPWERDLPLVIDPGLEFFTYLGGSREEFARGVAIDDDGNIHVVGETTTPDFSLAPWQVARTAIDRDIFWTMFNESGVWEHSARFGGTNDDWPYDIKVLSGGTVVIGGSTSSSDVALVNATDSVYQLEEGLLIQFPIGGRPTVITYFGGSGRDSVNSLEVGPSDSVYAFGHTSSPDLLTTSEAYCRTSHGSAAFAAKFDSSLRDLVFCTYIDGTDWEGCQDSCLDQVGNAYMVGSTNSSAQEGFPVQSGGVDTVLDGTNDGYVVKLNALGSAVLSGTYVGGNGSDMVFSIEYAGGVVLLAGITDSIDFPIVDALQDSYSGGRDAFLMVLDGDLSAISYSTYIGGSQDEYCYSLAVDSGAAIAYVQGWTTSDDLSATPGAFDESWGGDMDVFVAGIDLLDGDLSYFTFIGGEGEDRVFTHSIVCDAGGRLNIVGSTGTVGFPKTRGAYCATFNGEVSDAFLMRLDPRPIDKVPGKPTITLAEGQNRSVMLKWAPPDWFGSMGVAYHVYREVEGGNPRRFDVGGNLTLFDNDTVVNGLNYTYRVSASNSVGEGPPSDPMIVMPLGAPSAPRNPNATSDFGTVTLKWDPPGDTGGLVHGYWVYRRMVGSGSTVSTRVVNNTTFEDSDVEVGKEYIYWVSAYNIFDGPASVEAKVTVVDRPSPPTPFDATAGDNRVDLSWGEPTSLGGGGPLLGFYLARYTTDDRPDWNKSLTNHNYLDSEVSNGRQYRYVLVARTALGTGYPAVVEVNPYGAPLAPTDLLATRGNRLANLSWEEGYNNGRVITGYLITYLNTRTQVTSTKQIEVYGPRMVGGLTNGVEYIFTVAAINEKGVGEASKNTSCTPLGPPGSPQNLRKESTKDHILITWDHPADTGGAELNNLIYTVERRELPDGWETLEDVSGANYFEDENVLLRKTYTYRVTASHSGLSGIPSELLTVIYRMVPLPVTSLNATVVGETVDLEWTVSDEDIGSETTHHIIYRNESGGPMREYVTVTAPNLNYSDKNVTLGGIYNYKVIAVNEEGEGPAGDPVTADLRVRAGAPSNLVYRNVDGKVQLSWDEPSGVGSLPVVGYAVYRGRSPNNLVRITEVGPVLTYVDDIGRDQDAYYAVASIDGRGESERSPILMVPEDGGGILPPGLSMMVLLVLILVVIGIVLMYSRAIKRARETPTTVTSSPAAPAAPPKKLTVTVAPSEPQYMIEKVFVIFRDGRLIAECGRDECKTKDADLMSGMLIAVQGIVQDGLHSGGVLESIKYGDNLIMMAAGRHINLAAVILGEPDEEDLKDELEATVQRIEASYSGVIEQWIGDLSVLKDVDKLVKPLLDRTAGVSAEAIAGTAAAPGITVLSANDLHMGYVRLKVAVVNTTEESATEASIEVHYDHEMLRLERVRPEKLVLRGDRVSLGTVKPGERKSVAFLFDPQICQGTHIDGTLIYYDHKGELHRAEMKRRHAEVVCPILFTRKTASTAMLRRLIAEKLHASDLRVLRYPEQVRPQEVLEVGKAVMGRFSVQTVREYVTDGPPYEAEVWYYGETKVKGYELVMRLGVVAEKRAMEFFVASTGMEPITGLLAEFRREAAEAMRERHPGLPELVTERDDELKAELGGRDLLLDSEQGT